jgi:hypothetical protein
MSIACLPKPASHCRRLLPVVLLACILAVNFTAAVATAQDFEDDGPDTILAPSLLARLQTVHYGIVSGRLVATSDRSDTSMTLNLTNQSRRERVSIDVTTGLPTIHYEMTSAAEELLIDVTDAEQFSIRHTYKDPARLGKDPIRLGLEFQQERRGDLVLTLTDGGTKRTLRATSLWHLVLNAPKECRVELFPLLEMMRPSWHLASTSGAIEESLSRWAGAHRVADRRTWQQWVTELGSPRYAERQEAERNLLDAGPAVLPFLEHLEQGHLDAEQRIRLRGIIGLLDDDHEDTVERVVMWLAADPEVWLSLLSRPDESRRRLAADQLSRLIGSLIDFDPAADDAAREVQLVRLRTRLATPAAAPKR